MLLHEHQSGSPAIWDAASLPVADDGWVDGECFCECADATSGFDGLVENIHDQHYATNVRCKTTFDASSCEIMKTLAERLVHARKKKSWLQKDLAAASGVSMGMIGMLEKGKRGADGKTPGSIGPLAIALGVTYDWLAYGPTQSKVDPIATPQEHLPPPADMTPGLVFLWNSLPPDDALRAKVFLEFSRAVQDARREWSQQSQSPVVDRHAKTPHG